jgi:hypothetical protein
MQRRPRIKLGPRKSARRQHEHVRCDTAVLEGTIEPLAHLCDRMVGSHIPALACTRSVPRAPSSIKA